MEVIIHSHEHFALFTIFIIIIGLVDLSKSRIPNYLVVLLYLMGVYYNYFCIRGNIIGLILASIIMLIFGMVFVHINAISNGDCKFFVSLVPHIGLLMIFKIMFISLIICLILGVAILLLNSKFREKTITNFIHFSIYKNINTLNFTYFPLMIVVIPTIIICLF
jgi:Flp pilus assembly protein protease CpaA